jgi:shikimate kinase
MPATEVAGATPIQFLQTRIFLIGARGAGKTTVAQALAERLGWNWIDADHQLVQRLGKTIQAIFREEGEASFRDKEATLLSELCGLARHVIATGGGVVLRPDNRQRLCSAGTVIWLTADPLTLWQRLQADPRTSEQRPDLGSGGLAEMENVLFQREMLYRACAHRTIWTAGRTPEAIVAEIMAYMAAAELSATPGSREIISPLLGLNGR